MPYEEIIFLPRACLAIELHHDFEAVPGYVEISPINLPKLHGPPYSGILTQTTRSINSFVDGHNGNIFQNALLTREALFPPSAHVLHMYMVNVCVI